MISVICGIEETKQMSKGGKKRVRQIKKRTLNYREQTDGYQRGSGCGGGMGEIVMGIKECTCDEHRMLYGIVESLYRTPGTTIILYVN